MNIDNIRIFKEDYEFLNKIKEQLLIFLSEIGDYKAYEKIHQYDYVSIYIIKETFKYYYSNHYCISYHYSNEKDYNEDFFRNKIRPRNYMEWTTKLPKFEVDMLIRNAKINHILYE